MVCADISEAHILEADGTLDGLAAALEETRTTCATFDYMTDTELDAVRVALPGGPVVCFPPSWPWWYWGIPVILVATITILSVVFGVYGRKITQRCMSMRQESNRRKEARRRETDADADEGARFATRPVEGYNVEMTPFTSAQAGGVPASLVTRTPALQYAVPVHTERPKMYR